MILRLAITSLLVSQIQAGPPPIHRADQVPTGAAVATSFSAKDFFSIRDFILNFGIQSHGWSNFYAIGYIYHFQKQGIEAVYVPAINDARSEIIFIYGKEHSLNIQTNLIRGKTYIKDIGSRDQNGAILSEEQFLNQSQDLLKVLLKKALLLGDA